MDKKALNSKRISKQGISSIKDALVAISPYFLAIVILTVLINILFRLNTIDIVNYPIAYFQGDGVSVIHRTHEMRFDHSIFTYDQLASPYGSSTYDYYTFDLLLLLIQFVFANIAANYVLGYNLFLLSAIYFNGISAIYSLRRLQFSKTSSVGMGILYGLLPFFFGRYRAHVYLTFFFVAPLAIVLAIEVFRGDFVFKWPLNFKGYKPSKTDVKKTLVNLFIMIMIGMTGVYYALLSCLFIAFAAVLHLINDRKIKDFGSAIAAVSVSAFTFILSALPSIIYWKNNGRTVVANMRMAQNSARVSEDMGLKLIQCFVPNKEHRLGIFSRIASMYRDGTYTLGEWTESGYIGLVFACGLMLILIYIFILPLHNNKSLYTPLALFTMFILLIGSPSCMNFIVVKIFPYLRCYNRAVVYVAFMAAISAAYVAEYVFVYIRKFVPHILASIVCIFLMTTVVIIGAWDQTGIIKDESAALVSQGYFQRDEEIVSLIMNYATTFNPPDGTVDLFVMPYVRDETVSEVVDHQRHTQLIVHDENLCLSYGAPENRPFDLELYDLFTNHTVDEQIDFAVNLGYDGFLMSPKNFIEGDQDPKYIEMFNRLTERFGAPEVIAHDFIYWCSVN